MNICWVGFETGLIVICEYLVLYTQSFMQKVQTNSITFNRRDNQDFFSPFLLSLPLNLDAGRDSNATVNTDKEKNCCTIDKKNGEGGGIIAEFNT